MMVKMQLQDLKQMNGKKSYYNLINIKNKEVIFRRDTFFIFIQYCKRKEVAVLSAKLHDIGKFYELDYPFSEDFIRCIKGCITQHNGKLEYGSPRACNIEESFILNYADTVDDTMNKIEQIKENTKEDTWSDYDRRIETKLYLQ